MRKYVRSLPVVSVLVVCVLAFLSAPAPTRAQGMFFGQNFTNASGHTFTKVGATNFSCGSSPCTITYTSTPGNLLIVLFGDFGTSDYITALSGGATWTIPSGCQATASGGSSISCAYNISNTGATSFSMTYGSGGGNGTIYEFSYTSSGSVVAETPGSASNAAASIQTMISPSITGTNDVIFQGIQVNSSFTVNSFTGSYTVDQGGGTYGAVHLLNSTSTTAPSATLSGSSTAAVCELAFK